MAAKSTPQDQEKPEAVQDLVPKPVPIPESPGAATTDLQPSANGNGPEPEPATRGYRVTTRSDVLLNGQLYTEGDELLLSDAVARPLLKNRCVEPKDDAQ